MTQISWQLQPSNRAGGYIVTNTDWNDIAADLRAFIDQTTSSTTDNTPLPIGIDLVNDRVYISDPDSTTPEDGNHADTTLSVVGTTTLNGNTQQTGTFTVGVDDTGHDVKFFGATATNGYMLWDEDEDDLVFGSAVKVGIGETSPASDLVVRTDNGGGRGGEVTILNYASAEVGSEAALNFGLEASTYAADNGNSQIKSYLNNTNGAADLIISNWTGSGFAQALKVASDGSIVCAHASNYSPSSDATGQVQIRSTGYTGFIALNGTGMYIGHNSGGRQTYLMTNETVGIEIDTSQRLICLGTYNVTTAAAANMHVAATGLFYRSTSSAKYKTAVEDVADSYADQVLNLRPVWYRSLGNDDRPDWSHWGLIAEEVAAIDPRLVTYGYDYESDADTGAILWDSEPVLDDDGNPTYEQVSSVDSEGNPTFTDGDAITRKTTPRMVLDGDGNPVSAPEEVQYARIVPLLINIIKRQDTRIAALEAA